MLVIIDRILSGGVGRDDFHDGQLLKAETGVEENVYINMYNKICVVFISSGAWFNLISLKDRRSVSILLYNWALRVLQTNHVL